MIYDEVECKKTAKTAFEKRRFLTIDRSFGHLAKSWKWGIL